MPSLIEYSPKGSLVLLIELLNLVISLVISGKVISGKVISGKVIFGKVLEHSMLKEQVMVKLDLLEKVLSMLIQKDQEGDMKLIVMHLLLMLLPMHLLLMLLPTSLLPIMLLPTSLLPIMLLPMHLQTSICLGISRFKRI